MRHEAQKYFFDVLEAANLVTTFTSGKSFEDYVGDALIRSAVERQLQIIGEALSQIGRIDPEAATRISEHHRIVAFRNILVHRYSSIDDVLVWDVIVSKLPVLRSDVQRLLDR